MRMHHIEMYRYVQANNLQITTQKMFNKRDSFLSYMATPPYITLSLVLPVFYIRYIRNKTALSFHLFIRDEYSRRGEISMKDLFFLIFHFHFASHIFQYDRALFNYFRSVALYAIFVINIYDRPKSTHRQ